MSRAGSAEAEAVVEGAEAYPGKFNPERHGTSTDGSETNGANFGDDDSEKTGAGQYSDKIKQTEKEIFTMFFIIVIVIGLLIFLTIIRGFIIRVVGKDWFLPVSIISLFFILTTILVVGYENHIKITNYSLKLFLVFLFVIQAILLLLTVSQFFTHGNTISPAILSSILTILVLIWFMLSYKSNVRFLLLIYAALTAAFAILLLQAFQRQETS